MKEMTRRTSSYLKWDVWTQVTPFTAYTIQGIQSLYRLLFSNVCAVSVQLNKQFHLLKQTCHLHSNLQNNLLTCLNWMTKQNTSNMFQATFLGHRNGRLELPLTSLKAGRDHFGEKNKLRTLATLKLKINALSFSIVKIHFFGIFTSILFWTCGNLVNFNSNHNKGSLTKPYKLQSNITFQHNFPSDGYTLTNIFWAIHYKSLT